MGLDWLFDWGRRSGRPGQLGFSFWLLAGWAKVQVWVWERQERPEWQVKMGEKIQLAEEEENELRLGWIWLFLRTVWRTSQSKKSKRSVAVVAEQISDRGML